MVLNICKEDWRLEWIVICHLSQPCPIDCIRLWERRSCLHLVQNVSMWSWEDGMKKNASEVLMSDIKQYHRKMRLCPLTANKLS